MRNLLIFLLILCTSSAVLAVDVYEFDNDLDRERFQKFSYELRCPTCQSQNLAGSDAIISQDLKRELHRLIVEGNTDAEIIEFMLSRYGDFVLFKPRMQPSTYILWFAPLVLVLIGAGVLLLILRRKPNPSNE